MHGEHRRRRGHWSGIIAASCAVLFAVVALAPTLSMAGDEKADDSIKQAMQVGHKKGLLKKVLGGQASQEEKEKLLGLYATMYYAKPPRGEQASWDKKAGDLVAAAAKVVLKKEDGVARLKKATDCKGCHSVHKG